MLLGSNLKLSKIGWKILSVYNQIYELTSRINYKIEKLK